MKPLVLIACFAFGAGSMSAQLSVRSQDFQSAKIIQHSSPVFPESLISDYRHGGQARVEISVDADGKLGEWLVTGYTHRLFAESAVRAIKELSFEPALWKGEPVAVTLTLNFDFAVKGVVISSSETELIAARFADLFSRQDAYTTCSLRELDRPLSPLAAPSPGYPKELGERGVQGEVTVDFFIDEQGAVRMPYVVGRPSTALANLAVDAIKRWSFEPPMRRGRPALVHVRQLFRFRPTATTTTPPS